MSSLFENNFCSLFHHGNSLKGKITDYVIKFHDEQMDMDIIAKDAFDVVKNLFNSYSEKDKTVSARMITLVNYFHTEKKEMVQHYHSSGHAEVVNDPESFYFYHMLSMGDRMNAFNNKGSNLIIRNVEEIHIHINVLN